MYSASISRRKIYTNLLAVAVSLNGINIIFLVNLFTAIIIELNIIFVIGSFDGGNLIIKFIDTELHSFFSIYNSCSSLYSLY